MGFRENHLEFIIKNTITLHAETMPSKKYEKTEAAKLKQKRIETYENTFNQYFLVISLSYLLIAF